MSIFAGRGVAHRKSGRRPGADGRNPEQGSRHSRPGSEFLVSMADARLMDTKEGQLAIEHGSTEAVRDFGRLMVKDQAVLMNDIEALAAPRGIALPTGICLAKQRDYVNLPEKAGGGKEFDDQFIDQMRIDHERDIRAFGEARELPDAEVARFAARGLPMIRCHLRRPEALEDGR